MRRSPVFNQLPSAPGIYYILCRANNKIYVGKASNMRDRTNTHYASLHLDTHPNSAMQADLLRHGEQSFEFGVLIEETRRVKPANRLYTIERIFIHAYQSRNPELGYNGAPARGRLTQ